MQEPIRVLMLVENNSYPQDFRVRKEAEALQSAGCVVSVIAPKAKGQPWTEDLRDIGVYRFPMPTGASGLFTYALEFGWSTLAMFVLTIWISLRRGFDVIHAANPPDTLFIIGAFFRLFGKHYVFDQHDLAPETYLSRFSKSRQNVVYHTLRLLERLSYKVARVTIVTNESYKEIAIRRGHVAPDRVFIVRNGPLLSYQTLPPNTELSKQAEHIIGYVGTIGPQDGLDYWVRAVRELVHEMDKRDFLAVVIGDGDALAEVKALAKQLDVDEYFLFTGRLSERKSREFLSTASICVQPDPFSPLNDKSTMNKLMEYMALGKPTVAFDLVETRFSAGEAAIYVSSNDISQFAAEVANLIDNPSDRERLGEFGRQRVANGLAWEHSIPQLLAAYSECLGAPLASSDEA